MAGDFGRYVVSSELGRGAMGVVHRAEDPLIGRVVAIKALNRAFLAQMEVNAEEFLERFQREAQVSGAMNHPNIVKVFDLGPDYIVMEFVEGQTLAHLVKRQGALPAPRALRMIADIADALDYAHRQGVVHRDIKPGNVMVENDDVVKIMDFGLARISSSNLTAAGAVLGSASYMAPEVIQGRPADARSDIFSLGVLAYEVLAGQRPFGGKSVSIIITKIVREQPLPAAEANLPSAYDPIFQKVLAKDAADRYGTAKEFASALTAASGGAVSIASPAVASGPDLGDVSMVVVDADELGGFGDASSPGVDADATYVDPTARDDSADADSTHMMPTSGSGASSGSAAEATTLLSDAGVPPPAHATRSGASRPPRAPEPPLAALAPPVPEPPRPRVKDSAADSHFTIRDQDDLVKFRDQMRKGMAPPEGVRLGTAPTASRASWLVGGGVLLLAILVSIGLFVMRGSGEGPAAPAGPPQPGALVELTADVKPPDKVSGTGAELPAGATDVELPASVLVEFVVNDSGGIESPTIIESAGAVLDGAALRAVTGWRYEPAELMGVKVRVKQRARFKFEKP